MSTWIAECDADGTWHIRSDEFGTVAIMSFETSCGVRRLPGSYVRNEWEYRKEDAARVAAFIVHACNSHAALSQRNEELREALREIETIILESAGDCRKRMGTRVGNTLVIVRALLASHDEAKGGGK